MPDSPRVLLFSTLYPSSVRPGHGIFVETRLRELLSRCDVQAKVVAPVPWFPSTAARWGEWARMAATPRREIWNGIDTLHPRYVLPPKVGMTISPLTLALGALPSLLQVRREGFDFDLIDAHYYYPDGVAAALLAGWLRRPLAITARGTDLNLIPRYWAPRQMIAWAARRAQASIGVCSALMDVLRDWQIPNLHVMRNGVDLDRFVPLDPKLARSTLGIEGSGPVVLSVGHLVERKGHHLVIDAMPRLLQRHPDARAFIVGEGEERDRLTARIERLGLGASVRLVGAWPNQRLKEWYSAADVMVLASSREGWANVLLEAMACGAPVVASDIWGTPEVVAADSGGRLFSPLEAPALADAVLDVLERQPRRELVRRYAERFGWEETSLAQHRLFLQMVQARHA